MGECAVELVCGIRSLRVITSLHFTSRVAGQAGAWAPLPGPRIILPDTRAAARCAGTRRYPLRASPPRTAADGRTAALARRKRKVRESNFCNVKASLPGLVRLPGFVAATTEMVDSVSSLMHKGSVVFNRVLVYCLESGTPFPPIGHGLASQNTFYQCEYRRGGCRRTACAGCALSRHPRRR